MILRGVFRGGRRRGGAGNKFRAIDSSVYPRAVAIQVANPHYISLFFKKKERKKERYYAGQGNRRER